MPQNIIEKICQKFSVGLEKGYEVHSGDIVSIMPSYVMTHDNTGAVIPKFKSIGAVKLSNPRQVVHALDHDIQNKSEKNLEKYRKIEEFSKSTGADFYPAGWGIGHQIMCEEGYVWPFTLVVASDSHSNMYGGLGCLGTPIVRTDAAAIWATGRTWWQIPPVAKINLTGKLRKGVTGKDVIISLCGFFNNDEVLNFALEFSGDGISQLSIDRRLTIANMTTEWGALAGVFPVDDITIKWYENRNSFIEKRGLAGVNSDIDGKGVHPRINEERIEELKNDMKDMLPDSNAYYSKEFYFDLSKVEPYVSGPNTVKIMKKVSQIKNDRIKIHKAYLLSCVNSRFEDISEAASVICGKKVADGVKFYVAAASKEIQEQSEKSGDWQALIDAGAIALPPSCGPCIGLGTGLLEDGEVGISATNRNFKGRMGSKDAIAYLATPAVVAASAVSGYIDSPFEIESLNLEGYCKENPKPSVKPAKVSIIEGFPEKIEGQLVFCHQDNLNTDGIYPGKYTYIDDFKPEDQARVVMENYDTEFAKIVSEGDILVGGFNFGTGSSREQAATALKYKGIKLVIAGSLNQTYSRNALNNGYLCIEVPELVNGLKTKFGTEKLTFLTGIIATVDFGNSVITADGKKYNISPVGKAAQELIVFGGLENWVKNNL